MFCQKILNRSLTTEITCVAGKFSYNVSVRPRTSGFHIRCNSIISDQRICHNHCLSCIGRICENLKISCHRGIKYNFADYFARRTNALSCKNVSIFKYQKSFHSVSCLSVCFPSSWQKKRGNLFFIPSIFDRIIPSA